MFSTNGNGRQFVQVDNYRLGYVTAGRPSDPPIIFVHGWLSHARTWRQTLAALQDQYYCVSVDLLGHGYSDKPHNGDYSIPAQANRVLKLADALGIQQFTYIGHSMGGMIGLYLASTLAPERVTRLVDVSGVANGKLSPYVRGFLTPIYATGSVMPPIWEFSRQAMRWRWYAYIYDRALYYHPEQAFAPVEDEDRHMALMPGNEIPAYRDLQAIAALDLTPRLKNIQAPTLAVFGKYDNTVPIENGYLVKRHVPNSRLVLLDDCGHVPMTEQTAAYLEAVNNFLAD
ncbi:MAG TPA: alpha/beta hydrolase [Phototrophicaceae bacterium]|nr:alpha/beta hydrolase [Phototrophicaceae bacterium]